VRRVGAHHAPHGDLVAGRLGDRRDRLARLRVHVDAGGQVLGQAAHLGVFVEAGQVRQHARQVSARHGDGRHFEVEGLL
jgi:hypothetical protein